MKKSELLSLSPSAIRTFMDENPEADLPLGLHYWKIGLLQNHRTENSLYQYLLKYDNGQEAPEGLVKGLLGSEVLKNIYTEKDPLIVVIKSHLFFENFVNRILDESKISSKGFTFHQKINKLNDAGLLEEDVYSDLDLLNKLRNKYAHNYYFDIGTFDMSQFSICKGLYTGLTVRKRTTRGVLNIKTFQYYVVFQLLGRISYDFPYLNKLKIGKVPNDYFYKTEVGEVLGEMISMYHRTVEGTDAGVRVRTEIYDLKVDKSKPKEEQRDKLTIVYDSKSEKNEST